MDWKKAAIAATVAAVIGSAAFRATTAKADARASAATLAARLDEALPAAVVVAKTPGLSEILDLVLRERPTAAELTGRAVVTGDFPGGSEEAHVAHTLARYSSDRGLINRIASAIVKEGRRRKVGSSLLVGVLLTENPDLKANATSFVGARGLMQVMPFHAGKWGCKSRDLFDIESNICHGVAILADNLSQARTLPQALLGYNGCVRGTNTPDCFRYPRKVYGNARKGSSAAGAFSVPGSSRPSRGSRSAGGP